MPSDRAWITDFKLHGLAEELEFARVGPVGGGYLPADAAFAASASSANAGSASATAPPAKAAVIIARRLMPVFCAISLTIVPSSEGGACEVLPPFL
jgi:hypothetical protein